MTITDEFFQPARIYYDVYDQVSLQKIFQDLHCMDFDDQKFSQIQKDCSYLSFSKELRKGKTRQ